MNNQKKTYHSPAVKVLALSEPIMQDGLGVTSAPADPTKPALGKSYDGWDEIEGAEQPHAYSVWDE